MFWGITGDDVEEPGWGIASELVLEFAMLSRGFFRCPRRPWRRSSSYGGARELHLEYMEDNHSVVHTTRYFVLHILILMLADHSRTLLVVTSDGPPQFYQRAAIHESRTFKDTILNMLRTADLAPAVQTKAPFLGVVTNEKTSSICSRTSYPLGKLLTTRTKPESSSGVVLPTLLRVFWRRSPAAIT